MRRSFLVLALVLVTALTMTAVPASAASKSVIQTSNKHYEYSQDKDKYYLTSEWQKTYESGYLKAYENTYTSRNYEDLSEITGKSKSNITYKYNNGLLKTAQIKYDDGTANTIKYSYKGKNVSTRIYVDNGKNSSKQTMTYDKNGNISKSNSFGYENGSWKKTAYSVYTYDKKGRQTKYEYYTKQDGKWVVQSEERTTYSGSKVTKKYYQIGELISTRVDTLNSKGLVKKSVYTESDYKQTANYTYYSNGNIKTETRKDSNGNTSSYNYRSDGQTKKYENKYSTGSDSTTYTYNNKGLVTKCVSKSTYTYTDEDGNEKTSTYKSVSEYEYSNYYKSKYPRTIINKSNGEIISKDIRKYTYIVNKTPSEAEMIGIGRG